MGIGRRNFLKFTSLALTGVVINPLQSVIINDDVYVNKKLGILFYKPIGWGYVDIKDFGKIRDSQILANGWENEKDEVYEDLGEPICIITKYYQDKPEYKGKFSPTITLNITHKSELQDCEYESFEKLMEFSLAGTSNLLNGFNVTRKYEPYEISGCKFYEYDAEYMFEHVELDKPLKVELKVIKAEHNDYYYDFNCHQSSEQNQIADLEFENFKKSIKLI
ncbi:hypothetical protein DBB36_19020 [Flavobacterium sp. WLB]|uniref:hypothetical protein n=1 Tax=unclassified Flavobacterium TaxID=196869 RepID=UPI0006AB77E4|nr:MULTISPECIES: hypothetical protein [unclassified Flavobacterium]KOP35891.1 hypothetical protein AKO67_22855 [Flavobacterium sp. VMW]OWU88941.1 hypothetical protein APR43_20155 [Flavobacterium sp. NLM]PUU68421.1 hypothetical protein DBB36_19020 [Flavobacterium sp. WLB]